MVTPALGTQDVRLHIVGCIVGVLPGTDGDLCLFPCLAQWPGVLMETDLSFPCLAQGLGC
jgi:hypothetical protein